MTHLAIQVSVFFFCLHSMQVLAQVPLPEASKPGSRLSLNFQNIEVRAALLALAEFSGKNIVIGNAVNGIISLHLNDVDWQQAMEVIARSHGLEVDDQGSFIRIGKHEETLASDKQRFDALQQRSRFSPFVESSFPLQHRQASEIKKLLEEGKILSERGTLLVDTATNTLFVRDIPESANRIRGFMAQADAPVRQVMLEARIVEANDNFSRDLGVKLNFARVLPDENTASNPGRQSERRNRTHNHSDFDTFRLPQGVNLSIPNPYGSIAALVRAGASTLIGLELQAMQAEDRGQILSSPRVLTADRAEAVIEEGSEIPYSRSTKRGGTAIAFKKAALSLKVRPHISPDHKNIWIDIEISKDSPNFRLHVGGAPSVDTKRIQTRVQVEDGGTVVLGGIYIDEQSKVSNKIPLLSDIPFLGVLFRSQQTKNFRRELLVFITPTIIGATQETLAQDPEHNAWSTDRSQTDSPGFR